MCCENSNVAERDTAQIVTLIVEISHCMHKHMSMSVALNLWSADHQWAAAICLVVCKQGLTFICFNLKKISSKFLMRRSMGGAVEDDRRRDGETKYKKT